MIEVDETKENTNIFLDYENNRLSISEHTLHYVAIPECELSKQIPVVLKDKHESYSDSFHVPGDYSEPCRD